MHARKIGVGSVAAQGKMIRIESQLVPRDFVDGEKPRFQRFGGFGKDGFLEVRQENHIDLIGMQDAINRVQAQDIDDRARFFEDFARRADIGSFGIFHKTSGQIPQSATRLDGATAEQNFAFPKGETADHDFRILIMYRLAIAANNARAIVVGRRAQSEISTAAMAAIFHRGVIYDLKTLLYQSDNFSFFAKC